MAFCRRVCCHSSVNASCSSAAVGTFGLELLKVGLSRSDLRQFFGSKIDKYRGFILTVLR